MEKIKIQLSPIRMVKDAITIWSEVGPEVDIVMDLKKLTFRPGSIEEIYSFHVLDHLFPEETSIAISNWKNCLKIGGKLWSIVDDFEHTTRAFIGGDISIELFNNLYSHPSQFSRDSLVSELKKGGFKEEKITVWFAENVAEKFIKKNDEIVLESTKNE